MINKQQQFPLDAAQMLLGAAGSVQKYPLLCALITERAASLYLRAGRFRRFAMQEIMCGQRFQTMPGKMTKHAAICYAAALVVYDAGQWSAIKSRTTRRLIDIIMEGQGAASDERKVDGARRAFLLMLRLLDQAVTGKSRALGAGAYEDATRLVKEVCQPGPGARCTSPHPPLRLPLLPRRAGLHPPGRPAPRWTLRLESSPWPLAQTPQPRTATCTA